jgi:hypothetical protein
MVNVCCKYELGKKTINSMAYDFYMRFTYDIRICLSDRPLKITHFDTHIWHTMVLKDIKYSKFNHI